MALVNSFLLRFSCKLLRFNGFITRVNFRGINVTSSFGQKIPEAVVPQKSIDTFKTVSAASANEDEWVPIMEAYGDKLALFNSCDFKCTEIPKVLKFILQTENVLIRKEQALAVKFSFYLRCDDRLATMVRKKQHKVDGMNTRAFTPAKFGEMSDEFLIMKARDELMSKASVTNCEQLMKDVFDNIKKHQWVSAIVGCYLSKYLPTPRYPQQVFMKAAKSAMFQEGKWSSSEEDVILSHIACSGKWDLYELNEKLPHRYSDSI